MLRHAADYQTLTRDFHWSIPTRFNMGVAVCDDWARREPTRPALVEWTPKGLVIHSYEDLRQASNRLAQALRRQGIGLGERVALLLPQSPETLIAHLAIYKIGAIALPLAALFGRDALEYRLTNSGAASVITDARGVEKSAARPCPTSDSFGRSMGPMALSEICTPIWRGNLPSSKRWIRVRMIPRS